MDRILQSAPATVSETFTSDGATIDPGVVTVTITREDGTALYTNAATSGTGAAARTYNLTATDAGALDILTLVWTSATVGTRTSYIEVVGGFLFSLSDARQLKPLDNTVTYPTATLLTYRTLAEMALEDACGIAFVPRYARETLNGPDSTDLVPLNPRPIGIVSASVDGAVVTDAVVDTELGTFYRASGWGCSRQGVAIKYTHGYLTPPPRVGRAALLLAKRFLVDSPISDRATSLVTQEGTQFLVTAGVRDAVFDVPEANAVVDLYTQRFGIG